MGLAAAVTQATLLREQVDLCFHLDPEGLSGHVGGVWQGKVAITRWR